ncbi:protease FtsH subunit HflK [Arboricoccus pini]|uniref:Protein HflK n=1 Tax=Arboricoccus pini TaxID=1963835 RepID=A0A212QYV8_9PROT|nr:FtsH protease activity modulator HflK [Arboricoccus pini]SNB64900.1 protease FtsH subunit HflK [Arboricoccus pini]
MPWNSQGGGGWQGGQGPWGNRPNGNNEGGQPPDLEELLRRSRDKMRQFLPGGSGSGGGLKSKRGLLLVGGVLVIVYLLSGVYRVEPEEQGIVLRFGKENRIATPGLNYHWPAPFESVETPQVTRVNRVEIGFRQGMQPVAGRSSSQDLSDEALMLTGDENIIDINFVVLWRISDAAHYLFNIRDPASTVKAAAESVMREIIGQTPIVQATTEGRRAIEQRAREQLQSLMNDYGAGIAVDEVQLLKADPPQEVIDAFRDVQRAQADRERAQNEAEAYANDVIPRARGDAERVLQESQAYRQEAVARATGEAQRFESVLAEYSKAPAITAQRIYLETMEDVLSHANKTILDDKQIAKGVVPYLPLPGLDQRGQPRVPAPSSDSNGAATLDDPGAAGDTP